MRSILAKSIAALLPWLLLSGCTNLSDRKIEVPILITPIDLNEKLYVEQCLANSAGYERKYTVIPGSDYIQARIDLSITDEEEQVVRKNMRIMREHMTKARGRTANRLIFEYKNKTLEE
jgi:hypothetical protein